MSVTVSVCVDESFLLLKHLRYQNMNGTMLSEIVWVMFFSPAFLSKVAKICQKNPKVDLGLDDMSKVRLAAR